MNAHHRPRLSGRIAIAAAIVVPLVVWGATLEGGLIIGAGPRGEGCRTFWGETVDGVAWSPAGTFLVVRAHSSEEGDTGEASVRVYRWPGMDIVTMSRDVVPLTEYAIDDDGVVTWFQGSMYPDTVATYRMLAPGGVPTTSDGPDSNRSSRTVRVITDVSAVGIVAQAIAPEPDGPNRLCIRDA
jgi:hypothetical protein